MGCVGACVCGVWGACGVCVEACAGYGACVGVSGRVGRV